MAGESLENFDTWQAYSHPVLADKNANELLASEDARRYQALHDILWQRLIHVHQTIHSLETLEGVSLDWLYGGGGMEFWRLVRINFGSMAIVMLNSLLNDRSPDSLTITSLRNKLMDKDGFSWQDENARSVLRKELRKRRFDEHLRDLADRVNRIRNNFIAHVLIDPQTAQPKCVVPDITLQQLRQLYNGTQQLFGAIALGGTYLTLADDFLPTTRGGERVPNSLERILDAVLRDDELVNEPERNPQSWYWTRRHRPEDVTRINELRKRIGLPEA